MNPNRKIGLGTVQFGLDYGIANRLGRTPENEVTKIISFANENDIEYLDTASAYGKAETVLGKNNISRFKVVSKFMPPEGGKSMEETLNESLEKLNLERLYGYLAHRPDWLFQNQEQWQSLLDLKEKEKVQKIGFSLNSIDELDRLLKVGLFPDIIQVPFNFFDRRFEGQMVELRHKGCEIHTRSTFLQGLFFKEPANLQAHFDVVKKVIGQLQSEHGKYLSGALLKFVLDLEFIDVVMIGVDRLDQLRQNLANYKMARTLKMEVSKVPDTVLMPSQWPES